MTTPRVWSSGKIIFPDLFYAAGAFTLIFCLVYANDLGRLNWWAEPFLLLLSGIEIIAGIAYQFGTRHPAIFLAMLGFLLLLIHAAGLVLQHLAGIPGH